MHCLHILDLDFHVKCCMSDKPQSILVIFNICGEISYLFTKFVYNKHFAVFSSPDMFSSGINPFSKNHRNMRTNKLKTDQSKHKPLESIQKPEKKFNNIDKEAEKSLTPKKNLKSETTKTVIVKQNKISNSRDGRIKKHRRSSKHQMAACCNCKRRRKKCDGKYPVCSSCQKLGVDCTIIYPPTGREIKRDYLDTLEEKVQNLRLEISKVYAKNKKRKTEIPKKKDFQNGVLASPPSSTDDALSLQESNIESHLKLQNELPDPIIFSGSVDPGLTQTDQTQSTLAEQVGMMSLCVAGEPRYIGETSAYSMAKAIASSISCYKINQDGYGLIPDCSANPDSMAFADVQMLSNEASNSTGGSLLHPDQRFVKPSKDIMMTYLNSYYNSVQCQYPFLDWDQIKDWYRLILSPTKSTPKYILWEANFFIYMIFAISTQVLETDSNDSGLTKTYYDKAFETVRPVVEDTTVHAVQAYLLMAVFSQKMPDGGSIWQTTGLAIRTAIALGLHRKPYCSRTTTSVDQVNRKHKDLRARIFWSAYGIERINGVVLGRPFSISDVDIDAPLPIETNNTRVACHVVRLRRIQSNICTFIYKPTKLLGSAKELENTRVQIILELNDWMKTFPSKANAKSTFETDNWSLISYHNSILLLLRPVILELGKKKLNAPPQYLEWFKVFTESSSTICLNYKNMYLKGKLSYTWLAMHCCFVSGISFLYSIWLDCSLHILKWKRKSLIYETINACSIILYVLSERWHEASVFRDGFERMSTIVKNYIDESGSHSFKDDTGDILRNGVFENGSINMNYYLKAPKSDSNGIRPKITLDGETDGIMFPSGEDSEERKKPDKTNSDFADMDKVWEFLDTTGDKYLRDIFSDMEDRMSVTM